jgi:O-antigen/teichoic acid export membrane protein
MSGVRGSRLGGVVAAKAATDVFTRLAMIVVVAMLLRYAGTASFGAWSQIQVLVSLAGPFAVLGVGHAIVPHFSSRVWDDRVRGAVRQLVVVGGATTVGAVAVLVLIAPFLGAAVLDWPQATLLFRIGAPLVGLTGLEWVVLLVLQARRRYAAYVLFQTLAAVATVGAAVVIIPRSKSIVQLLTAIVVLRAMVLAAAIVVAMARDRSPVVVDQELPPALPQLLRFGIAVAIADVGAWAVQLADRLVVGHYASAEALGAYAAIYTATGVLTVFGAAVFLPVYPELSAAWQRDGATGTVNAMRSPHHLLAFGTVPLGAYLLVITLPALRVLGKGNVQPSFVVVVAVVMAAAVSQWNGLLHYVVVVTEGGRGVQAAWLSGGLVAVVAALALVPSAGILGAGISTLLAFAVINVLLWWRASQHIPIVMAYAWRTTVLAIAASVVAAGGAELVVRSGGLSLPRLATATVAFWIVYGALMAALGEFPLGERRRATTYQRLAKGASNRRFDTR